MLSTRSSVDVPLRMAILGVVITSMFVALFARLIFLQVIDSPRLTAAATANQTRLVYEPAPRGRILDRNGNVLAGSRLVDVITVDRASVSKHPEIIERLAQLMHSDVTEIRRRIDDPRASRYRPAVVAEDVAPEVVGAIRERQLELPGVAAESQVRRWYPNGTLAAHLLGYIGEINDKELSGHKSDGYRLGDDIGKSGLESAYEPDLRGKPGVKKIEVDSAGNAVRVLESTPAVSGHDLHLSLDLNMQRAAEEGMARALDLAKGSNKDDNSRGGSVVAVDPRNGGVLVMASYPSYSPENFARGISQDEYTKLTKPESGLPLNNRALQGQYAPGSTFKLVTATAGLRSGAISPETTINDSGVFVLGAGRFQNAQGKSYGQVNVTKGLTVSSDVFFYNLGAKLWESRKKTGDPIQQVAKDFGLGVKSGIELPGETAGRIPDPDSRKKLHQQMPNIYPEGNWYAGDNVNLAIGQGDALVTPVQLADMYATFGNGGTLYRPRIVDRVSDGDRTVSERAPEVVRKVDLPSSLHEPIEQGLMGAVRDPRGTAFSAFSGFDLSAFRVAGKTGTAQVTGKQDSALFAAYGPVGGARVAVAVVLEQAGWGSTSAAPVARQVFAAASGQTSGPVELASGVD